MKKFKFRLQTLLDQRQSVEDRLLAELGEVRQEEAVELRRLDDLRDKLAQAWQALTTLMKSDAGALERCDDYAKTLRDDIRVQELTIEGIRAKVEAKRAELAEAMKQRKVIEALRDKQEQAYIAAALQAEQTALDEMSSLRYARGM